MPRPTSTAIIGPPFHRLHRARPARPLRVTGRRALAAVLLAAPFAAPLLGQQGAGGAAGAVQIKIKVDDPRAASGVMPFASQGQNAVFVVTATNAAGQKVDVEKFAPRWTTDNEDVVSFLPADAKGPSVRVVAQKDGQAVVTVSMLGQTATQRVVVGEARKELGAGDVAPAFRIARLEIRADRLSGRVLLLGENGENAVLEARAYAADGRTLSLVDFPVKWTTDNEDVAEFFNTGEGHARVVGRKPGRAVITASVLGVTATIPTYVGDARSDVDASLLTGAVVVTSGTTAASAAAASTVTTSTTTRTAQPVDTTKSGIYSVAPSNTTTTTSPTTTQTVLNAGTPIEKADSRIAPELQTSRGITVPQITAAGLFPPVTQARSLATTAITATGLFPPLQTARTITTAPIVAKGQP